MKISNSGSYSDVQWIPASHCQLRISSLNHAAFTVLQKWEIKTLALRGLRGTTFFKHRALSNHYWPLSVSVIRVQPRPQPIN